MSGPSWSRRAGVVGLAAGLVAGAAALGVVAERYVVGRRVRQEVQDAPDLPCPTGTGGEARPTEKTVVITDDGVPLHAEIDAYEPATAVSSPGSTSARRVPKQARSVARVPTIVLVHGWALTIDSWCAQRPELAAEGRVVLYDQRGHGRSGRGEPSRSTIDQLGRDLATVLDQLAPEGPLVLIGHSMGGMTIMALADQHPELFGDRVVGVALCSTSPGALAEVTMGIPARAARFVRRAAPAVLEQLLERPELVARGRQAGSDLELLLTKRYSFGSDVPPALVRFVSQMISSTPLETIAEFWVAFDAHDKLAALRVLRGVETLVLVGEDDLLTPAEHSRAIAAEAPDATLVIVPAAGHLVMLEHPETVNAHLRSFLARALHHATERRP